MIQRKTLFFLTCIFCIKVGCKQANIPSNLPGSGDDIVHLSLKEGTNMASALSTDGNLLIVDLHGTLWLCSSAGGQLESLTEKTMDARQPHWSGDGTQCTFQAFEEGNWHIYTLQLTDKSVKKITNGLFDHREPYFLPNGDILFSSDRSGNYDIWSIDSEGNQLKQITQTNDYDEYGPAASSDGKSITYIARQGPHHELRLLALAPRQITTIYESEQKLFAPTFSGDQKLLFFNEVGDLGSQLFYVNQNDSPVKPILISENEDVFPFRISHQGQEIIYTSSGKIRRRDFKNNSSSNIPFKADVTLNRDNYTRKKRDFDKVGDQIAKGIYQPTISPDGHRIAFIALGDLWLSGHADTISRITNDPFIQVSPAWSIDGKYISYATDQDGKNAIWKYDLTNRKTERVGFTNGLAVGMDWTADGNRIAYTLNFGPRSGVLFQLDVPSGKSTQIGRGFPFSVSTPSWSTDQQTIALSVLQPYSNLFREGINRIVLAHADGSGLNSPEILPHMSFGMRGNDGPNWSPKENKMVFLSQGFLWMVTTDGKGNFTSQPQQITEELSDSPSWTKDGNKILFQTPHGLKTIDLQTNEIISRPVNLSWQKPFNNQSICIQAGAVFNGNENLLLKNKDILIKGNRIVGIEDHDPSRKADVVLNAKDKFIMPGLIDIHAHQGSDLGESLGRKWLVWGITSNRDPATNPYDAVNRREGQQAGSLIGPRIFFTGSPLDGNRVYYGGTYALQNKRQLEMELDRAAVLDYDMVKTYVRLNDPWQQEIIQKAHEIGIPVSSHELYPAVSYGIDAVEHILGTSRRGYNTKMSRIFNAYEDVTDLIALSGMKFTPTIGIYVGYEYMLAKDSTWSKDPRITSLVPSYSVQSTSEKINQVKANPEQWETLFRRAAKMLTDINKKGGHIVAGTDSPIIPYGFGLHVEIEAYQLAGLTPFETLQTATINAAKGLGAEDDLGSIEVGKLADILILNENPLDDVRNTRAIESVIINGKLHDISDLLQLPLATTTRKN